jgi:hypothetical protein
MRHQCRYAPPVPDSTFHSDPDPDLTFQFDPNPDPTTHISPGFGSSNAPKWPSKALPPFHFDADLDFVAL